MQPGSAYASSMKSATPLSKSPALYLNDELIYESGAIITELLARFPHKDVEAASSPQSTFWGYFSEGSVMLFFQPARFLGIGAAQVKKNLSADEQKGAGELQKWFDGWSNTHVAMAMGEAEKYLGEHEWFSGSDKLGLGDVSERR
jgi:glutathione S-transferase